jgi:hypothetical protein
MHVKRIHDMIEKLTKCAEMEFEKGVENINAEEMGEVTDMIKDLAEAEYYAKISKAMDEAEYGEDYDYMGAYDEHSRKGYRGQPRDSKGRYMSRRGCESRMMPEMDWDDMEYQRDMDRNSHNRMYYTDGMNGSSRGGSSSGMSNGGSRGYSQGGNRDYREGRSGQSRRSYMESKEMHKDNSPESKQEKMKSLEDYMKSLAEDVTEMVNDMSQEEKSLMKQKMQVLMQKIQ